MKAQQPLRFAIDMHAFLATEQRQNEVSIQMLRDVYRHRMHHDICRLYSQSMVDAARSLVTNLVAFINNDRLR